MSPDSLRPAAAAALHIRFSSHPAWLAAGARVLATAGGARKVVAIDSTTEDFVAAGKDAS